MDQLSQQLTTAVADVPVSLFTLDLFGTLVFAYAGATLARERRFNLFGVLICAGGIDRWRDRARHSVACAGYLLDSTLRVSSGSKPRRIARLDELFEQSEHGR